MLHRALQQFLADVYWGDLDVLLMDLPPGTGDIAISVAQLVPTAEILVVTTPQQAAAEVAERAGAIALQTHQQIAGVIENMSWLAAARTAASAIDVFGTGGGQTVADALTRTLGTPVPLLGQVPLDVRLREGGDGQPLVLDDPDSPAAAELTRHRRAGSAGRRAASSAGRSALPGRPLTAKPARARLVRASGGRGSGRRGDAVLVGFGFVVPGPSAVETAAPARRLAPTSVAAARRSGPVSSSSSSRCFARGLRGSRSRRSRSRTPGRARAPVVLARARSPSCAPGGAPPRRRRRTRAACPARNEQRDRRPEPGTRQPDVEHGAHRSAVSVRLARA